MEKRFIQSANFFYRTWKKRYCIFHFAAIFVVVVVFAFLAVLHMMPNLFASEFVFLSRQFFANTFFLPKHNCFNIFNNICVALSVWKCECECIVHTYRCKHVLWPTAAIVCAQSMNGRAVIMALPHIWTHTYMHIHLYM